MNHTLIDSIALPLAAAALQDLVRDLYTINFNIVASATFLFWDILLTFDREVEYIWKSKFSLITLVFGGVRLLAVGGEVVFLALSVGVLNLTGSACKGIIWFEAILGLVMSTGSDILLISRVYAFYGRNKMLLRALCVLEAMVFVAVFCMIMIVVPPSQITPDPFPQLHIGSCILPDGPRLASDIWVPIFCVQAVLFSLVVGRYLYLQWKGPTLIGTLYYTFLRDGIWCSFVLFVIYLLTGNSLHSVLGLFSLYWCFPLIGICTSRLILNLRSASGPSQDYSFDASRINTKMNFAEGMMGACTQNPHEVT